MKVRAKLRDGTYGFYGTQRRRNGDEFEIDSEKHLSANWMEAIEPDKPKRGRPKKEDTEEGGE